MSENLLDLFSEDDDGNASTINDLRVSEVPTFVIFFTSDTEDARLHFLDDSELRGYANCPGPGRCPLCHVGDAPKAFLLLPVFSVDLGDVAVLRVSRALGPGALGPALRRVLAAPDVSRKVVELSRRMSRYRLTPHDISTDADRGELRIKAFLEAFNGGLRLQSAYLNLDPEDLASIPRIRRKLDVLGGFAPRPQSEGRDVAATNDVD